MARTVLLVAGFVGVLVALAHGWLGHRFVLTPIEGLSRPLRRVNAAVFQLSTIYWLADAVGLIATTLWLPPSAQVLAGGLTTFVFGTAALGNLWAMRGRHVGGHLAGLVAGLSALGAWMAAGSG